MKIFTGERFSFSKSLLVTLSNLFYSINVDSSQIGNTHKETATIRKYKNINRINFALDETMPFKSITIDEFIPIKY
jgi:hypothetical protein